MTNFCRYPTPVPEALGRLCGKPALKVGAGAHYCDEHMQQPPTWPEKWHGKRWLVRGLYIYETDLKSIFFAIKEEPRKAGDLSNAWIQHTQNGDHRVRLTDRALALLKAEGLIKFEKGRWTTT